MASMSVATFNFPTFLPNSLNLNQELSANSIMRFTQVAHSRRTISRKYPLFHCLLLAF